VRSSAESIVQRSERAGIKVRRRVMVQAGTWVTE
jgi:hypothetical protein